ncbi:hypothetical protein [Nocardia puris]|uniref:Uncharacterized protein n=1 Tax=Nocardia puris TaxID=208602 RepID=A0A366DIL5_9NOCA|nr:hypothetical protein [Nocardia puris]RBO89339.1 hypothetical protein DFR74_10716 [Nocardia puris]
MTQRRKMLAAATALTAVALPLLAMPTASAAQSVSVLEGRGRYLVTIVKDSPAEPTRHTIWLNGNQQEECEFGRGDLAGAPKYHRICPAPAGEHRLEVREPDGRTVYDGRITVPPANGLLDIIDTVVTYLGLPLPTDPTYQDSICKKVG